MSSLTPSPVMGLHRFDTVDAFVPAEVNENTDLIDTLPPTVCTSATRPISDLYTNRLIWETDTKALVMWDGAAWRYLTNDIGVISAGIVAIAAGWSIQGHDFVIRNRVANLYMLVTRTGANIAASASGNVANTLIATVSNVAYRPAVPSRGGSVSTGFEIGIYILPDGTISVNSAPVNTPIATNDQFGLAIMWDII